VGFLKSGPDPAHVELLASLPKPDELAAYAVRGRYHRCTSCSVIFDNSHQVCEKFHQLSHDASMIGKTATDNSLLRPAGERV